MRYLSVLLLILLLFWGSETVFSQKKEKPDSLFDAALEMPDDTAKVNKLNELVWRLRFSAKDNAIKAGKKSLKLAVDLSYESGAAYATKNLGGVYYIMARNDSATIYYERSLELFKKLKDRKGIAIAYRNLGNTYHQRGNWKKALELYLKSLKIREEINDKKGIAATNTAIGLLYVSSTEKNQDNALGHFTKALEIHKEKQDSSGIALINLHIGNYFFSKKETELLAGDSIRYKIYRDSALHYFKKSKGIYKSIDNNESIYYIRALDDAIGATLLEMPGKLDSAFVYLKSSLDISKKTNNTFGIAATKLNIGNYYMKRGNKPDSVEKYFLEAFELSRKIGAKEMEKKVSGRLAGFYETRRMYKNSVEFYKRYIDLNDSLTNEKATKKMTQLEMQYEFDKQKKIEDELHKAEVKQQKKIRNIFIGGFLFVIILAVFIFKSYRDKKRANALLEERNNEILDKNFVLNQQKEEIIAQRDEIEKQRDYVVRQRDKIAEQNKSITDSIVYAQRIQQAVMPPTEYFKQILKEYFILFKPRDIVSGDYYWATQKDGKTILTAADCTGHGVPGAFMSLLGVSFLNEIVNKINPEKGEELKANLILNQLRDTVKKSLRQTGDSKDSKDGMDMALCIIDNKTGIMQYAGANNPALIIRNGELIQYKADRMPVGVHYKEKPSFTNHEIKVQEGDAVYLFSDGYIDQFGGEKGRKFMIKRFKKLLLEIAEKPMTEQREILDKTIEDWKKGDAGAKKQQYQQVDDVIVIGFRF